MIYFLIIMTYSTAIFFQVEETGFYTEQHLEVCRGHLQEKVLKGVLFLISCARDYNLFAQNVYKI